jgi:hypothetical protein
VFVGAINVPLTLSGKNKMVAVNGKRIKNFITSLTRNDVDFSKTGRWLTSKGIKIRKADNC